MAVGDFDFQFSFIQHLKVGQDICTGFSKVGVGQ